jgi:hypothetical protein
MLTDLLINFGTITNRRNTFEMRKHSMLLTNIRCRVHQAAFASYRYSGKHKLITHRVVNHQEPTVTGHTIVLDMAIGIRQH